MVDDDPGLIGVLVTFEYGDAFDKGRVEGVANAAQAAFAGMPGLRLKAFTVDEEHRRATNVYLWESEEAARAFFDDALRERVTGLYGVAPRIEFVEIAALVDNA